MPRTKLDGALPNPSAVSNLVERYVKIERRIAIDEVVTRAGTNIATYYRRIKNPSRFTLAELRSLAKALKIPQDEMLAALVEALKY